MEESRFWHLLSKKLSGQASKEEVEELERAMKSSPLSFYNSEMVQRIWEKPLESTVKGEEDKGWKTLSAQLDFGSSRDMEGLVYQIPAYKKWIMAAVFVGVLAIGAWLISSHYNVEQRRPENRVAEYEVTTPNGSGTEVKLPDGTTVTLNGGSKLHYSKDFAVANRNVRFTGEAYFNVAHNARLPFTIFTDAAFVKVLGTAFNVRAYPDENVFETSLVKGKVELSLKGDTGRKIYLSPMEKITVAIGKKKNTSPSLATQNVHLEEERLYSITKLLPANDSSEVEEVSWLHKKYVFRSENFENLATRLEKWYGVSIVFDSEELKKMVFTGVFDQLSLEEALKALQFSSGFLFGFRVNNKEVCIYKK